MVIRVLLESVSLVVLWVLLDLVGSDDLVRLLHRLKGKELEDLARWFAHRRQQVHALSWKVALFTSTIIFTVAPTSRVGLRALLLQDDQVALLESQVVSGLV